VHPHLGNVTDPATVGVRREGGAGRHFMRRVYRGAGGDAASSCGGGTRRGISVDSEQADVLQA